MNLINLIKEQLIKEISLIEEELKFYGNLNIENKSEKIITLLENLVIKEQTLIKWDKITTIKKEKNDGTDGTD